jgi:hypothetical protein
MEKVRDNVKNIDVGSAYGALAIPAVRCAIECAGNGEV